MTNEQNKALQKIINTYGVGSQRNKAIEECAELIQAIIKHDREYSNETYLALIDEIADVEIMVNQLKIINGVNEVNERIDFKINRQLERIKNNE